VVLPLIAAVALLVSGYLWIEVRRTAGVVLSAQIRDRQDRLRELAELIYANSDAESSQRGYLLTGDRKYLEPFDGAERSARTLLDKLQRRYRERDAVELPALRGVATLMDQKFTEMHSTIELVSIDDARHKAVEVVRSNKGLDWMVTLRGLLEDMRERERVRVYADVADLERMVGLNRLINTADMLITLCMLMATAVLVVRDIERRNAVAQELDAKVSERTAELTALADHSRRVIEEDRQRLARELHDEMGGILVGIKMDLAQLAKKINLTEPLVAKRWAAIQSSLNSGIELKRRVIEELRPTLLDNMGLAAALRWQAEELCQRAGLKLRMDIPEEEPRLDPDLSIELFRVLQETLTNVVKHARATTVIVRLEAGADRLVLTVEDDGVGLTSGQATKTGSHGLLGMRYRAQSLGGTLQVGPVAPHGTRVSVRVPLAGSSAARAGFRSA
jgi:signal transduction histidine kinase